MLGPATVALALALYKNLKLIHTYFVPIIVTFVLGSAFTILSAFAMGLVGVFISVVLPLVIGFM